MMHLLSKTKLLLILLIFFSNKVFADHDFKYKNVFACGPSKVDTIPKGWEGSKYFVIHDNEKGDKFSIYNGYEYSSFKKNHYAELYVQRGGERWLNF